MLTVETLGPAHLQYNHMQQPGFTQARVLDEEGKALCQFFGPMAKINANAYTNYMNQTLGATIVHNYCEQQE